MKRILPLIMIVICLLGLCIPASARSNAHQMSCEAEVKKDGSCDVTIRASVVFDETVRDPQFPIPKGATMATLNGSAVNPDSGKLTNLISLSGLTGNVPGTYSLVITYHLDRVVKAGENGAMQLEMPILCGFGYPVDELTVAVKLPGDVKSTPVFISGYHQENTAGLLDAKVSGSMITVISKQTMLDHETLTMQLAVEDKMFPGTAAAARVLGIMDILVLVAVVLAAVYYFLTMQPVMPRKILRSVAPDGITAGQIPLWLTGRGTDLSVLVVSWAQMGYLRLQVEEGGRVLLHKRMEMGNERSAYENRVYKSLFGRRLTVDGTGEHYARLVKAMTKKAPLGREVYQPGSGNPYIFRALCALAALLSGIGLAGAMAPNNGFLAFLLAVMTAVLAVLIQSGARALVLRRKLPLWIAAGCAFVWLVLGICAGEWLSAVLMIAVQFIAGIGLTFGGKRTELGQQALVQIMGLRKFMRSVSKPELQRLLKMNPGYFHALAPYALELGVDREFARRFGRLRIPECTYLVQSKPVQMTAAQWAALLRDTVNKMDAKANSLPIDRLMGK